MEITLEGGTDAGGMVVFDPAALPDDFDTRQRKNPVTQLEDLSRAGRLYWLETCADGHYELGVYVGDRLPKRLQPFARWLHTCDHYHVPSGRLYFTGVEYAFHTDDSTLRKYPHMGECVAVEPCLYRADFFEFEYPEEFEQDLGDQRLSDFQQRMRDLMGILAPVGCVSLFGLLGSLTVLPFAVWAAVVLPCGLLLLALPILLSRMPEYRKAEAAYSAISREFPAYGVLLHPPSTEICRGEGLTQLPGHD